VAEQIARLRSARLKNKSRGRLLQGTFMLSASNDRPSASMQRRSFADSRTSSTCRRRYYGRYLASAVILAIVVISSWRSRAGRSTGRRRTLPHGQVDPHGLANTIVMTILAMALGIVLGVITAIMRLSTNPVVQAVAHGYVWLFRGTPVILQLLLWFNLALVFPVMGIPGLFEFRTVDVMTPFLAALLGLGINQGAYTSEVVRAGLLSVDTGQYEAAKSIGMPKLQALRRVILPQAMRVIVPPIGNELIGMVKLTSLASVIQYAEMLHNAENIYYANARVIELLMVAGVWYLVIVTVLSLLQSRVERRFARGAGRPSAKR
jgi:polar amino acid transport system permease protein